MAAGQYGAAKKPVAPAVPAATSTPANEADFFGEGTTAAPAPDEAVAAATRSTPADIRAGNGRVNGTGQSLAFQTARGAQSQSQLRLNNDLAHTWVGTPGTEWPFVKDIPGIGNTLNSVLNTAQSGPLAAANETKDHPGRAIATLGFAPAAAGFDTAADELATGLYRDVSGNDHAQVDIPGTPGQVWEPKKPFLDYGDGTNLGMIGVRDVGEGIRDGAIAAGKGIVKGGKYLADKAGDAVNGVKNAVNGIDDWLDLPNGGTGGGAGGGAVGGNNQGVLDAASLQADNQRTQAAGVMNGTRNAPSAADRSLQTAALGNAQSYQTGPRAVDKATAANTAYQTGPRATDTATAANTKYQTGPRATDAATAGNNAFQTGPRATDAATSGNAAYRSGPRAQNPVMGQLDRFVAQGDEPTKAQLLLDQASQGAMSDVLAASRSGRARDAGSQARQASVAQGEIAGMGVDNARNAALLRQQEAQDFRNQQLTALGQQGALANSLDANTLQSLGLDSTLAGARDANTLGALQANSTLAGQRDVNTLGALQSNASLAGQRDTNTLGALQANSTLAGQRDTNTLGALNTGADIANNIATQGTTQRGQTLNYGASQDQSANQLQGDVIKTIPQLEQIQYQRDYELTPEQKLKLGLINGVANAIPSWL